MLEKIVEKILGPILSQYVEDFNSQNMKIGLWSGLVEIKNVRLRKQIIKKLNLPFKIKHSWLGTLKMTIPWKSLGSSKIDILIQGLQLLITEVPQAEWQCKNHKIIEKRKQELTKYCQSIIDDFAKKSANAGKNQDDKGYFSGIIVKVIDNIQVTIKDIHVRYEDEITNRYSFGVTLQQLKIYTVNKNGDAEFIDRTKQQFQNQPLRKKLILSNFGIYWNERTNFFKSVDPHPQMQQSIAKIGKPQNSNINYLILMSSNALLYQRQPGKQYIQPQINLFIQFQEMRLKISNMQLQQIVTMSQRLQTFMNEVKLQNRKKLTQQQKISYHKQFLSLFPNYFQKKSTPQQLNKIQQILEKMEVQNFQDGIKTYLKAKQKEKMIQSKLDSKKGWFSWSKATELTAEETEQIQLFMKDNFGLETKSVKRPQQFYYIKVNFKLNLLNLSIANTKTKNKREEGVSVNLQNILLDFNLRQGGYLLNFGMASIDLDMYEKPTDSLQLTSVTKIIQKLPVLNQSQINSQYAKLRVVGNPLQNKHLDVQISLTTQELLVEFDPRIIKVAQDFADIKINSKNTQAALEAYGQLKNKVAQAASSAAQSINKPEKKKNFISLDVNICSVNIILFFDPAKVDRDIWAINLGMVKIFSDAQTLKKPQFTQDEAMQKYCMKTSNMSMVHYQNKDAFFYARKNNIQLDPKQTVLDRLQLDFQIQLFQKASQLRPSIRARTLMHRLNLNLSDITYPAIQKIGNCFQSPVKIQSQIRVEKQKEQEKVKANEKSEIMKQSKKLGIVYEQSKTPTKYIAVLSGGYIYMFVDKKDIQYSTYYYVRNSKLSQMKQDDISKKPFSLIVENSVNKFKLGFDKENAAQQWMKAIKSLQAQKESFILTEQQDQKVEQPPKEKKPVDPNLLNFQVYAAIGQITINTLLYADRKVMIGINSLNTHAKLHEAKTLAKISLKSIQLTDNIFNYKYQELRNFLYSESIQGKQQLIDIDFQQLSEKHPQYQAVGATISMEVGKFVCNYKPQTVENVMKFFLPKPDKTPKIQQKVSQESNLNSPMKDQQHLSEQQILKKRKLEHIKQLRDKPELFNIKLNLKVQEVSIALVNRKTRVMFAKIGIDDFRLAFAQSNKRMLIQGTLGELYLSDYSNYPNTIIKEQAQYTSFTKIVQTFDKKREMVAFDIQMLEIPNQFNKTMIIKAGLYDLQASYNQQPVLRMITYLTQQLLPSLTPTSDDEQGKKKSVVANDVKPENSTMEIMIDLENIRSIVQPRNGLDEYLQLLIKSISVRNSNILQPYIKNPTSQQQKVLIQNYEIKINGIKILQKFRNKQISLTNDLNIDLNTQLIQNSPYYQKTYGSRYQPGMRVSCKLTPFLMRINHEDYNFIMKCLFWNITYDDNAEGYIFDGVTKQTNTNAQNKQTSQNASQPIYCRVFMDRIILCVIQNGIPLTTLFLANLKLNLNLTQSGMLMIFEMKDMYGIHTEKIGQHSIQKGIFNLFGIENKIQTKLLYEIQSLVNLYSVERVNQFIKTATQSQIKSNKPVIYLEFQTNKVGDTFIRMNIQGIKIAVQLKNLLILSKLAIMQPDIQPTKSTLPPILKKKVEAPPPNAGKMVINMQINNFLGSLSDKSGKNYVVMQGSFLLKLKMQPSKKEDQVIKFGRQSQVKNGKFMDLAAHVIQIRSFSLYFCNIKKLDQKRYILLPIRAFLVYEQVYGIAQDVFYQETVVDGNMEKTVLQCSIKDMLMIKKIAFDNLDALNKYNKQVGKSQEKDKKQNIMIENQLIKQVVKSQISQLKQNVQIDKKAIEKKVKQVQKKIKDKMTVKFLLQPIQIKVINDCNNNFMPVLNFILQESTLFFSADAIKSHIGNTFIMELDFFNPRSANWQPILQTFKISFDYLTLMNQFGSTTKIIISSNNQVEQLKQLKINFSTQLVSTLLIIMDIAKNQQKKIQQVQKQNLQTIEVSPYVIQNQTNKQIQIQRFLQQKKPTILNLPSLFKGPVKLQQQAKQLNFIYKGSKYSVSLQRFGVISIPGLNDIHLNFRMDKVNRVLGFYNSIVIKNATFSPIYVIRYAQDGKNVDKEPSILMQPGDSVPLQLNWYIQLSFNMNSFTVRGKVQDLLSRNFVVAQTEKFKLSILEKRVGIGHSILMVRTPFVILNCLPKDMQIQFINNGKQVSSKKIPAQGQHEVFANQDTYNMRFKIICEGFYWSQEFWMTQNSINRQNYLYMNDRLVDGTTIKYIFTNDLKRNQIRLNIFCPAFIVSQLDYDLEIYANLARDETNKSIQKYYKLGGQSQFWTKQNSQSGQRKIDKKTLIGVDSGSKIRVCGKNCLSDFSQPISIVNIGLSQARVALQRELNGKTVCMFTNVGVEVELKKMAVKADVFCRQITLRSRWIFYNNTKHDIMIKQQGSQRYFYQLKKGEKKPFYFVIPQLKQRPKNFIFKTSDTGESMQIMANGLGAVYFRLQLLSQPNYYLYFKLNTQQIKSYLFYDITEVDYQNLPYQIVVKTQKLEAFVPNFQVELRKNSPPLNFINQFPHVPYNLQLYVRLVGSTNHQQITVQADNLNFKRKLQFYQQGLTQTYLPAVVYVIFNDSRKYIVVDQIRVDQQTIPEYETQTINFKLQKLSISIIQNHNQIQVPFEAFYFYMQNLEFIMQQTNKRTKYQAKLQFMQFDQCEPFNIPNPVIITPIKYKQFTSTDPKDKPKSIFNALVQIDNSFVKNLFINQMIIDINDLVVKVASPFIKLILQIVKEYTEAAKGEDQYLIKVNTNSWQSIQIQPQGSKTFIKSLCIAPFTVDLSAQIRLNELDTQSVLFFGTILNALGVVITNIQGAPIVFRGIVINDCIDTLQGINSKLIEHYKGSVVSQLYKVFGSLNIIGNPVGLFRNISTGIKDLKDKPSQGFVQGPLEFGKGLAEGTSSLIAHSVGGALNSVQKMTGTLATGLAALTFDKQFQQMRQRQKMKKPKHVLQGLGSGGKAVFTGFKEGITGLFTKPVQNAKKEGVLGFLKGTAQGVTGLVVKPVTGVIDFASKTTQGLKNTALYLQDKPNQNRIRNPRVLYTQTGLVKQYDEVESRLLAIIRKSKYQEKYNIQNANFIASFRVGISQFLVVLSQNLVFINIHDQNILWVAYILQLKMKRTQQNAVDVESPPKNKQFWQKSIRQSIKFQNKQEADRFEKVIIQLKANYGKSVPDR